MKVRLIHRLVTAHTIEAREEEDLLEEWFTKAGVGVCALHGVGGAGKSIILERFIGRILSERRCEYLFAFSFENDPMVDSFIGELSSLLGAPSSGNRLHDTVLRLLEAGHGTIIAIDGLEAAQSIDGKILDSRLRELFQRCSAGWLPGVGIVCAGRIRPEPLAALGYRHVRNISVGGLATDSGVRLLRAQSAGRLTGPHARSLVRAVAGHPLSLVIAGQLLRCEGRIANFVLLGSENPDAIRLQVIVQDYLSRLRIEAPTSSDVLHRLALFELGLDPQSLALIVRSAEDNEAEEHVLARVEADLELLYKAGLLVRTRVAGGRLLPWRRNEWIEELPLAPLYVMPDFQGPPLPTEGNLDERERIETLRYSVHPALRSFVIKSLQSLDSVEELHDSIREQLEKCVPAWVAPRTRMTNLRILRAAYMVDFRHPSDASTLDLLEEISFHALMAGEHEIAWAVYSGQIGGFGNLEVVGDCARGVRICNRLAGGPSIRSACLLPHYPRSRQTVIANEWGLCALNTGNLRHAAECFEFWLSVALDLANFTAASSASSNLTATLLQAGRFREAEKIARRAIEYGIEGDGGEGGVRAGLVDQANAYHRHAQSLAWLGRAERATEAFDSANRLRQTRVAKVATHLNSRITDVPDSENARDEALDWKDLERLKRGFSKTADTLIGCLTWVRDYPEDRKLVEKYLIEAGQRALEGGNVYDRCTWHYVNAWIEIQGMNSSEEANPSSALTHLRSGRSVAEEHGMSMLVIDFELLEGRIELLRGDYESVLHRARRKLSELTAYPAATADAQFMMAEALLLKAASEVGESDFLPSKANARVRSLIEESRSWLKRCIRIRRRLRDPVGVREVQEVRSRLKARCLTDCPSIRCDEKPSALPIPHGGGVVRVFISYQHSDAEWLDELGGWLRPHLLRHEMTAWADRGIPAGEDWEAAILSAIEQATVAVLLVSDAYLRSNYIQKVELPVLLERVQAGRIRLVPVCISHVDYGTSVLSPFQSVNDPMRPLNSVPTAVRADILGQVCEAVRRDLTLKPGESTSAAKTS